MKRADAKAFSVLLGVRTFGGEGIGLMSRVFKQLKPLLQDPQLSSIYSIKSLRRNPRHSHDLLSMEEVDGFSVVAKTMVSKSPEELLQILGTMELEEYKKTQRRALSLNLLAYEDQVVMTPQLTLPHPEFYRQPEFVIAAAEVWGEFEHPILKKTLYSLTKNFSGQKWGEFYGKGQTLLDF